MNAVELAECSKKIAAEIVALRDVVEADVVVEEVESTSGDEHEVSAAMETVLSSAPDVAKFTKQFATARQDDDEAGAEVAKEGVLRSATTLKDALNALTDHFSAQSARTSRTKRGKGKSSRESSEKRRKRKGKSTRKGESTDASEWSEEGEGMVAYSLCDYLPPSDADARHELPLRKGQKVTVLTMHESGWLRCETVHSAGAAIMVGYVSSYMLDPFRFAADNDGAKLTSLYDLPEEEQEAMRKEEKAEAEAAAKGRQRGDSNPSSSTPRKGSESSRKKDCVLL
jgi:hypothetical protein